MNDSEKKCTELVHHFEEGKTICDCTLKFRKVSAPVPQAEEWEQKIWNEILDIVHPHFRELNEGTPSVLTRGIVELIQKERLSAQLEAIDIVKRRRDEFQELSSDYLVLDAMARILEEKFIRKDIISDSK